MLGLHGPFLYFKCILWVVFRFTFIEVGLICGLIGW